jgi:hypothetical protein
VVPVRPAGPERAADGQRDAAQCRCRVAARVAPGHAGPAAAAGPEHRRGLRRRRLARRPAQGRPRRLAAPAPALPPPDPAARRQPRRRLRPAHKRGLDLGRALPAGAGG